MQFDIPESLNSGCKCLTLDSGFWTLDTVVDWFRTESCRTQFLILLGCESKDLMVTLICRNSTGRNFYWEALNYTTGTYLRLFRKAVQGHPFSKISPENTSGGALILVKLQTDCSEERFILKRLYQEFFLGNLSKAFRARKYHRGKFILSSKGDILLTPNICLDEANLSWNHIFFN